MEFSRRSSVIKLMIRPSEIHYLTKVLEGYEGLAMVTTLDSSLGLVQLSVPKGCEKDVMAIIEAESNILEPKIHRDEDEGLSSCLPELSRQSTPC